MSSIVYNLLTGATLNGMAPADMGGGNFSNANLPAGLVGAGMYLIINTETNNRYIGISTNLAKRFGTRMATVTEAGFSAAQMQRIGVYWGTVTRQDTGNPVWSALGSYDAPCEGLVDGVTVNFERLLIRFVLTQLGVGGTVSNNMMASTQYRNSSPNPVTVTLNWGNGIYGAGTQSAVWRPNASW
jgi:hypothetical protein